MLKTVLVRAASWPAIRSAFKPCLKDHALIFMLHRFHEPERGVAGHDPEHLRRVLAWLRREGTELIELETLVHRIREGGPPLRGAVAFTIDDGYYDHAEVGAPVFAEFDCPVTTFATTGFLDRSIWFWWDRIEYILHRTTRTEVALDMPGEPRQWSLTASRTRVQTEITEALKRVPDVVKHQLITSLADMAEVEVPQEAPPQYAPMSWEDARRCERLGMRLGPHTVTHPILTQISDEQATFELSHSWRRIQEEMARPSPVFCYPNGGPEDFGEREVRLLGRLGVQGAVVGTAGYVSQDGDTTSPDAYYQIRRFSWPGDFPHVVQYTSGLERLKMLLRGQA